MDINNVVFSGNVGNINEPKYFNDSNNISFSFAINNSKKNKDGTWDNGTLWVKVVLWGTQADRFFEEIKKGDKVVVQGQLKEEKWTNNDGEEKKALMINAVLVEKMYRKPKEND